MVPFNVSCLVQDSFFIISRLCLLAKCDMMVDSWRCATLIVILSSFLVSLVDGFFVSITLNQSLMTKKLSFFCLLKWNLTYDVGGISL